MSNERIKAWSYSRLVDFEQCKLRAKLKYIDRIPEPARPLPPGKTEHANDRGTRIHDAAERFVRGGVELIPELKAFSTEFHDLRNKYEHGMVSLEGEWAINKDWEPVAWGDRDAWARIKLDAFVRLSKTHAVVIDYKGLPLNTLIPTPSGWTTMGEIQVGDKLFDINGAVCEVCGKSETKHLPNYRITFDDTSVVECDEEHLWTLHSGDVRVVTELAVGDLITTAGALQLPEQPLHPSAP